VHPWAGPSGDPSSIVHSPFQICFLSRVMFRSHKPLSAFRRSVDIDHTIKFELVEKGYLIMCSFSDSSRMRVCNEQSPPQPLLLTPPPFSSPRIHGRSSLPRTAFSQHIFPDAGPSLRSVPFVGRRPVVEVRAGRHPGTHLFLRLTPPEGPFKILLCFFLSFIPFKLHSPS
jgi:hypothetical protein